MLTLAGVLTLGLALGFLWGFLAGVHAERRRLERSGLLAPGTLDGWTGRRP